ncbi:MAG: response regulator transcription factor [Candidatus Gracilibacteria bacterium]|nr:response regulator transcription factor [Candidatus Gracilibacteria bacterium]
MRILLVEDNIDISDNIKKVLMSENPDYMISQSYDGEDAIKQFLLGDFNLILLDLNLPKLDGVSLCKRIRLKSDVPIIMMTALGDDDDKILGLESGADDYIVKPFKIRELQARINVICKRLHLNNKIIIRDLEIDFTNKVIKKGNDIVPLKLKEFQIFELIYNKKTISRSDLISDIWGDIDLFTADNKLDVNIYSIRNKLGKDIIKTIKGFGYSIIHDDEI